ncbi:MAG: ketoacyl-ACP synthase III [Candidatus Omnitrophica bacterium]|nr:ketoacyl-ACP synthase III [Candidatus Omnitrophota bacterium]
MTRVGIIGVGDYLPKRILNNSHLEKMVNTSDEWIFTRTGIKERRIARKNESTSDMAVVAARRALRNAHLKAQDVDLIIVATITGDMHFPSTACLVQNALGAFNAACFDINAACPGFVYALVNAQAFIKSGIYRNALIIGAEKLTSITDWTDRNTCILFGDGAGAAVLAPVKRGGILSSFLASNGALADLLFLPAGGSKLPTSKQTLKQRMHFIKMRGNELFKFAVKLMVDAANSALKKCGLNCSDVTYIIPHQANIRILLAVARKLGLPKEKIFLNLHKYGNMSSASTAVALSEVIKKKKLKKGDILVLDAFGAGLVWGAAVIEW